jgi:hypothetical protein
MTGSPSLPSNEMRMTWEATDPKEISSPGGSWPRRT